MQGVLTGYKHFVGKNGQPWFVYSVIKPFGESGKALCVGMETAQYWSQKQFDLQPNDKIEMYFEPDSNGNARLAQMIKRED